jgi:phosphatidylserine/phosphatidylglycerophosphate/cardiolipin synthase-like enzyme
MSKGTFGLFFSIIFSIAYSQSLDVSGFKVVQANAGLTITLPAGTVIQPGGYLVIGRNATQTSFEQAWGITLGGNVTYINGFAVVGSNGFPTINGAETYKLQNASSVDIDGPSIAMPAATPFESIKRLRITGAAGAESSWVRGAISSGNPGSGIINTGSGKLVISEFSDATAFANEFVELYYDVAPPPTGDGTASVSPERWKFNASTEIQFIAMTSSDTMKGIRIVRPGPFSWSSPNISVDPPGAIITSGADTVTITGFTAAPSDSVIISITGVTASDTTNEFTFSVATSTDGTTYLPIQTQPKTLVYGSPRPIAQVKKKELNGIHSLLGKWAVVKGVVTVANEFGGPSYLQDASAGMAIYDSSVSNHVERGDEVILLGLVAPFNDLFELAPCTLLEKVSEGNPIDTLVITVAQAMAQGAAEPDEGKLVKISGITSVTTIAGVPASTWATTASGTNYKITDPTGTMEIRISSRTNIANTPTPVGTFDVVGVLGQFLTNYQLLPRIADDIIPEGNGPRFTSAPPYERSITSSSINLQWTTDVAGTSKIEYGTSIAYGLQIEDTSKVTNHSLTLNGLQPATVYHLRFVSENTLGVTVSSNYIVSTASQNSTGKINVYFSKSIDTALARGENAKVVNLASQLAGRLNAATYSIDAALYSFSGTVGSDIANALIQAKNRGVKVRVIGEKDNQSTAPWTTLKNNGITVIDDGFDAVNAGAGLMHNKFFVIDNRDSTSDTDDWVWTGSWNLTDPGTNNDAQNAIEIQDKALANAYTLEFEEMWGSKNETPNAASSRFGARKSDNIPHLYTIGGIPVELYFSPSDRTNNQIIKTVNKAQSSVNFALLTFTRSDIGNALYAKKQSGVKVRGVFDNGTDQGSQFDTLKSRGLDIFLAANLTGLLHHKYAIIDADGPDTNQYVLTGSHNWSSSAENSNNENTLILRSKRLANLYLQEFSVRYTDAGGKDVLLHVDGSSDVVPAEYALEQNFPNPFNPATTVRFSVADARFVTLKIFDILGREIATLVNEQLRPGNYSIQWNGSSLSSGVYFYRIEAGNFRQTKKMLLQK